MGRALGMEEALEIAMGAEAAAAAFYAQAALEVSDVHGRDLLGRLAAFEQYHFEKLAELQQSWREAQPFAGYEGRTLEQFTPLLGQGEAAGALLEELRDVPGILSKAIEKEREAGGRYRALAKETTDAQGQAMFRRLADEEALHQRILEDEFFSISNRGVWGWSGLYGE